MDFRPYIVAVVYVIGLVVLIAVGVHPVALATFFIVGGFFSLLFGLLHRIEENTKKDIEKVTTGETVIIHKD